MTLGIQSYKDLLQISLLQFQDMEGGMGEDQVAFLWDLTKKACQEDFYIFTKTIAPLVVPGFRTGRHIEIICKELQALYQAILTNDRSRNKLQVFLPPESSKTLICSHLFPAWCLGNNPNWRVIAVAHSAKHAEKELGANAKRVVNLPEYQEIFPKLRVSRESPGVGFWKTTKGGYYFSAGWESQLPGKRCNLLIGDDIVSEHTKPSEIKTINHNYSSGAETRMLEEHSGQLIVNTRWYLDDIAGYLEKRDGGVTPLGKETGFNEKGKLPSDRPWRIIRVPALLDKEALALFQKYPLFDGEFDLEMDYVEGGSYWPQHKSLENIYDARRRNSPHQWAALYMQNPLPEEGSIFDIKKFQAWRHPEPPEVSTVIISLDTAFTEKETKQGAESAYQIWGIFPLEETNSLGKETVKGSMILLGARKGHWGFPELKEICLSLYQEYGRVLDFFLIEDRASGISLIQELRAVGLPVVAYSPDRDKVSRAHAAGAIIHSNRVYINPNLIFTQEFLAEVIKFPSGGRDTVDAMTQAILWMRDSWHIEPEDYKSTLALVEDGRPLRPPQTYWAALQKLH